MHTPSRPLASVSTCVSRATAHLLILVCLLPAILASAGDARFMVTQHDDLYKRETFNEFGALMSRELSKLTWSDYGGGNAESVLAYRTGTNTWNVTRTTQIWNNPTNGLSYSYAKNPATGPEDYGDPSEPAETGPPSFTWGRVRHTNESTMTVIYQETGMQVQWPVIGTTNIWTEFVLETGGESGSTNQALFQLGASASEWPSGTAVPSTNITIMGKQLDEAGAAYEVWNDNVSIEGTIAVSSCGEFTFSPAATKASLQLRFYGTAVTGQTVSQYPATTNKLYVGASIYLTCDLDAPIATITNYTWALPGPRVKYFQGSASSGGPIFPLLSEIYSPFQSFAWYEPGTYLVSCTVQVAGQTLTARATFVIADPGVGQAVTSGQVGVSANNEINSLALHFGGGSAPPTPVGMQFTATNTAIQTGSEWQWVQLTDGYARVLRSDGWWRQTWDGLDKQYPYPPRDGLPWIAADNPALQLDGTYTSGSITMNAQMFLMWRPPAGVWVTVWKTDWMWMGIATNAPPWGFFKDTSGVDVKTNRIDFNGVFRGYPFWTTNAEGRPTIKE